MASEENEKRPRDERDEREEEGGIAGEVLRGLGNMIPGLCGLLKGLEKSPAFRERLKAASREVEARLREAPLREAGRGRPPSAASRRGAPARKMDRGPAPPPREVRVDVMDERDSLRLIAELPGFSLEEIGLELREKTLIISSSKAGRAFHHEVDLPVAPARIAETAYRNGILEVTLPKG